MTHSAEKDAYREVWVNDPPPGGYLCSQCLMPVESEPCPTHGDKWANRDLFAADADVTVYWPDVRPCYDATRDLPPELPLHRTAAGWPNCSTCDGGGCPDCTDPA